MALGQGLDSLISSYPKQTLTMPKKALSKVDDKDKLWHISFDEIIPNSEQPRKHFSHKELEDLVNSIKEHGILQPLTVSERPEGGYELIAGERRYRASQIAGLKKVPCLVRSASQQERLELALVENIQRQNLNAIEEAFSFKRLVDEFFLTQQEVANKVGKSRSHVANTIRLMDLPDEIKKALVDGILSSGKARALLSLKDQKEQIKMFKSMIGETVSTREVERRVAGKGEVSRKGSVRRDPNILAQEQLLEDRYSTRINISKRGEKGKITIEFNSVDEFRRLMEELS